MNWSEDLSQAQMGLFWRVLTRCVPWPRSCAAASCPGTREARHIGAGFNSFAYRGGFVIFLQPRLYVLIGIPQTITFDALCELSITSESGRMLLMGENDAGVIGKAFPQRFPCAVLLFDSGFVKDLTSDGKTPWGLLSQSFQCGGT